MAAAKGMKSSTGLFLLPIILNPLSDRYAAPMPAQTEMTTIAMARRAAFMGPFYQPRPDCIPAAAVRMRSMGSEDLKATVQRRRYADYLRRGEPVPADLVAIFRTCPLCQGRKYVCEEYRQGESLVASLDDCPSCEGEGFVERVASP
jgi:hypothetical protein